MWKVVFIYLFHLSLLCFPRYSFIVTLKNNICLYPLALPLLLSPHTRRRFDLLTITMRSSIAILAASAMGALAQETSTVNLFLGKPAQAGQEYVGSVISAGPSDATYAIMCTASVCESISSSVRLLPLIFTHSVTDSRHQSKPSPLAHPTSTSTMSPRLWVWRLLHPRLATSVERPRPSVRSLAMLTSRCLILQPRAQALSSLRLTLVAT